MKHYTHTFHSVPIPVGPDVVSKFLESFEDSTLFDPLSIYESTTEIIEESCFVIVNDLNFPLKNAAGDVLVLKVETEDISDLFEFLKKAQMAGVKRVIHVQKRNSQFSAQLSLFAAMKNLKTAAEAPSNQLDPEIATNLTKDATNLFSQSEHVLNQSHGIERILRNPKTESLLIESTAIPILVRCCTLLARPFRRSAANETIRFKTIRVFPVNSEGEKFSTFFSHLSLLKLPNFFYEKIKTNISTPATLEIDEFHIQGPLVQSQHQAQCCVAFEAAKLLFAAGILDENLLLAVEYRKEEAEDSEIGDSEYFVDEMVVETFIDEEMVNSSTNLSFNEIIPRALLKGPELFIYALEFELKMHRTAEDPLGLEPEPVLLTPFSRLLLAATPSIDFFSVSQSNRTWAILLPSQLPDKFVPVEIPIGADHFLKTSLKFTGKMTCDSGEYEKLLGMQQFLFGMFNMKPITVPDSSETEVNENCYSVPKDKQPFYLIAPLTRTSDNEELTGLEEIPRVWDLFKQFIDSFTAAPLEGTLYAPNRTNNVKIVWRIDWSVLDLMCADGGVSLSQYMDELEKYPTDLNVQLEEGGVLIDFKRFALERLAFLTPHTKIFYRLSRPIPEPIYPSSPFTSPAYPHVNTHAEYVQARYNLSVREMDRAMLAVKRIENWSDLAVWISEDGGSKKRRKKSKSHASGTNTGPSLIIPELARVFPVSYSTFRVAMLLPRVSFEIERQLRISQFFTDRLPASLPPISHALQIEAMTASPAALSYSYEQLEVLGDSFLKYYSTLDTLLVGGGWSEGRLSAHRQKILCNATLRKVAETLDVTAYASFTPFFAKLWSPPALHSSLPPPRDPLTSALNRVLFAPEERWIALAGVEGRQVQKQAVYLLNPQLQLSIDENYKTREQAKNSTGTLNNIFYTLTCFVVDAIYKYGQLVPPKSLADLIEALIAIYYIDAGVQGALHFLTTCGILRPEIFRVREIDPLRLVLGDGRWGEEEQMEKLKRRKITPISSIILKEQKEYEDYDGDGYNVGELLAQTQALTAPLTQKIENVQPHAPPFASFPFPSLESVLGHPFTHRPLLFMACTHSSVDAKLNGEKLEWIGDAAVDWIVCRHYWYNYRAVDSEDSEDDIVDYCESNLNNTTNTPNTPANTGNTHTTIALDHPREKHVPYGYLPLNPESLTNSRQSAINNDSFARLVVQHRLHRFLRINSPHLQLEIDRFAQDQNKDALTPAALEGLQTHVSVAAPKVLGDLFEALMGALLLDSNLDIDHFATHFAPFLETLCPHPSALPTNAIQQTLHLYARLGIPRHQIVCTYREISCTAQSLGVVCQVWVRERCVAEAEGSNKLVAKKLAMEKALHELQKQER